MALSLMIFLSLNPSHLVVVDKVLHVLVFYWMTVSVVQNPIDVDMVGERSSRFR